MAGEPKIVTKLGKAESDRILVRGHDLIEELLGKITFSQMTFLMLEGRLPNPGETRMIDALLTVLVEHGLNASVIAARLTYSTAPQWHYETNSSMSDTVKQPSCTTFSEGEPLAT